MYQKNSALDWFVIIKKNKTMVLVPRTQASFTINTNVVLMINQQLEITHLFCVCVLIALISLRLKCKRTTSRFALCCFNYEPSKQEVTSELERYYFLPNI